MMYGTRILKLHIDAERFNRSNARPVTADQPTDISVAVAGGNLAVSLLGKGKSVLLLHGWTFDRRMWSGQYPLAESWQLVMPDRRGFGQSSAQPSLQQEYADIDRLIPAGQFAIIGFSQGAAVAMDYARRYPERVAALVVAGAPLHNIIGSDPAGAVPVDSYRELIAADNLAGMKEQWRGHRLMESEAANNLEINAMLADYTGRDLVEDDSEIELTGKDISNLSMPVLALTGETDTPWRCAVTKYIGDHAQSGESHIMAGAGHLCSLEKPIQFNRLVDHFIHSNFQ
jgi:pimeloyl-ACP methyl ester carboxylesterase